MSRNSPFFSIVTVVYNDKDGLMLTHNSIEQQDCRDYEWVVIDGGSDDGAVNFLEGLNYKNLKWVSESDDGIYQAMNKGVTHCSGRYIVFLNAGDIFTDELSLSGVEKKLVQADTDVLFGGANFVMPNGTSAYRGPKDMDPYINHGLPGNHQATYFRRELIDQEKFEESYRICGDYYLIAKLFMRKISYVKFEQPIVDFRVGDTSYKNPLRLMRESNRIQRDILSLNWVARFRSSVKRFVSIFGLFLYVNNVFPRLLNNIRRKIS